MIQDRKRRQFLRTSLIIGNILLLLALVIVTIWGIYSLRNRLIQDSIESLQYYSFSLSNIGKEASSLEADYLANIKPVPKIAPPSGSPKIAILLTNLGFSKRATQMSLILPVEVGFGFYPYTTTMKPLLYQAAERGHEIFLYIPFEQTDSSINPGKLSLLTAKSSDENITNINRLLSGFTGYTGVYAAPSEGFTKNPIAIAPVIEMINGKKLLLVLGEKRDNTALTKEPNVLFSSLTIDEEPSPASIKSSLAEAIALAKLHGNVLCYAQSYPVTINLLLEWIPSLIEHGIELVPVSSLRGS
ncbi:MAG: divergent polysaccharide deacetylase family protein [Pseudomonadota bacterium]